MNTPNTNPAISTKEARLVLFGNIGSTLGKALSMTLNGTISEDQYKDLTIAAIRLSGAFERVYACEILFEQLKREAPDEPISRIILAASTLSLIETVESAPLRYTNMQELLK